MERPSLGNWIIATAALAAPIVTALFGLKTMTLRQAIIGYAAIVLLMAIGYIVRVVEYRRWKAKHDLSEANRRLMDRSR